MIQKKITKNVEPFVTPGMGCKEAAIVMLARLVVAAVLTLFCSLPLQAASLQQTKEVEEFEPAEMMVEFEEEIEPEESPGQSSTFEESQVDDIDFDELDHNGEETTQSFWTSILSSARLTLKHELFYKVKRPRGVKNNRSSVRLEYSRALGDYFFIQLDVQQKLFWPNDHQAQAKEQEVSSEFQSREIFLQTSFADTSIKAGRQILIWGESEGGAITDVISPRDYSEAFFISLEESRVGQSMILLDQFTPIGNFSCFYVPHAEFNEYPGKGSAYDSERFDDDVILLKGVSGRNDYEFGGRWKKTFGQSDVAVMGASLIENDYIYHFAGKTGSGKTLLIPKKERFAMAGVAFNYLNGSFLYKGEVGYKSPLHFQTEDYHVEQKDVLDTAVGWEYSPGGAYTLSVELVNCHIRDWGPELISVPEDDASVVLVWDKDFLHEKLSVNWMSIANLTNQGFVHILRTSYEWDDHITLVFEAYCPDIGERDNDYWRYREEKQLALKVQYQF